MTNTMQRILSLTLVSLAVSRTPSVSFDSSTPAPSPTSMCSLDAQYEPCTISAIRCDFYTCLGSQCHCQGTQCRYPFDYGYESCTRYEETLERFTPAGRQWIYDTRLCLQNSIVSKADCTSKCKVMQEKAFASHPACYVDSVVCTLFEDWINIINTVGVEGLAAGGEQITETIALCVAEYEKMTAEEARQAVSAIKWLLTLVGEEARTVILKYIAGPLKARFVKLAVSAGTSMKELLDLLV